MLFDCANLVAMNEEIVVIGDENFARLRAYYSSGVFALQALLPSFKYELTSLKSEIPVIKGQLFEVLSHARNSPKFISPEAMKLEFKTIGLFI
jgi:hypothetical protein